MIHCFNKTYRGICAVCGKQAPKLGPTAMAVLERIARGSANDQIASALGIASGTVNYHIARLFAALEVSNRVELIVQAHLLKLVVLDKL